MYHINLKEKLHYGIDFTVKFQGFKIFVVILKKSYLQREGRTKGAIDSQFLGRLSIGHAMQAQLFMHHKYPWYVLEKLVGELFPKSFLNSNFLIASIFLAVLVLL